MTYEELVRNRRCAVLLNQQNGMAELYDLETGALDGKALLRSFDTGYATGLKLRRSARFGGDCLFVATGGAAVFSLDTGEKLWEAPPFADNPHSVEWIEPMGILCLACSSGSTVLFYRCPEEKTPFAALPLADAHGVLWDETGECLWAAGGDRLVKIRLRGGAPAVEEVHVLPRGLGGAHDLAAVYGAPHRLWLTCNVGQRVVQYDKAAEAFSGEFPGSGTIARGVDHKGIGNYPDGSVVYLYPCGRPVRSRYHEDAGWLTDRVWLAENGAVRPLVSPTGLFYKLRVCRTDYQ
ncbi:MAG: hypothetical protein IJL69_05185 [Oscillospiraceae bacterium]|nr:hypothetical protein [Oscillospiraceae bacterium]